MAFNNRILAIDDDGAILDVFHTVFGPKEDAAHGSSLAALGQLLSDPAVASSPRAKSFALDTAFQGQDGFALVKKALNDGAPYTLVFIDMRMPPGWNGIETARKIREIDPEIQIVIVTAYSDASVPEIVRQVGFTERLLYLKKPFDDEEILQLADSLTMRWNLEQKTCNFMELLHAIFHSFVKLDFLAQTSDLRPFLEEILRQLSDFLDTPNIFLTRIVDDRIDFQLGLGRFSNGHFAEEQFQAILTKVLEMGEVDEVLRLDDFVVMPIICRSSRNIVVGIMPEQEIIGTDKLLTMLARYTGKLCDTGTAMQALQQRNQELEARLADLEAKA